VDNFSQPVLELRDTDMLEALDMKVDLSNLPIRIRYRGVIKPNVGVTAGQDLSKRVEAVYFPPWSGEYYVPVGGDEFGSVGGAVEFGWPTPFVRRTAGISRWFTETMANDLPVGLTTWDECLYAAILAAMQYALGMRVGQFQMPGLSRLKLNDLISVVEEATATNSRLWITSIESEHINGGADTQGRWTMTITGSMIDFRDMAALIFDLNWTWKATQRNRSAWRAAMGTTTVI
jgi:hypothetical protein